MLTNCAKVCTRNPPTAIHSYQYAKQTSATRELRMCSHLNRAAHPRKLARFGNNRLIRIENELQNGHRGTRNTALHKDLLVLIGRGWDRGSPNRRYKSWQLNHESSSH